MVPTRSSRQLSTNPLAFYQWRKRLLLIFSAEADERALAQIEAFETMQEETAKRELVLLKIIGSTVSNGGHNAVLPLSSDLRQKYALNNEIPFAIIGVGKDGQEKFRMFEPIEPEALFHYIDEMIRRTEKAPQTPPKDPAAPRDEGN